MRPRVVLGRMGFAVTGVDFIPEGNLSYEPGDMLWGGVEFIHGFLSEAELRSEFAEGGFDITHLELPSAERGTRGGAVLRKHP